MSTPTSAAIFAPLDDLDPATPGDPFTRLRYNYGQLLGAEDFTAEQRYFLLRSRLHNAALHGFGTVWGLKVDKIERDADLALTCEPGLAIDPLGREIRVPQKICLDVTGLAATRFWADLAAPPGATEGDARRRAYVVLRYRACLTDPAPAIVPPCADQDAALAASRVTDGYRLCLEAAAPDLTGLPVRDITLAATAGGDARARLLDAILTPPTELARLWSGADDAPLLLAVLDLEPIGTPAERVKLNGPIDNAVRALLPHVQAVADLALGLHLESSAGTPRFQAARVTTRGGDGADAGHTLIDIATTRPPLPASLATASARVLYFDDGAGAWADAPILARSASAAGLALSVDRDFTTGTCVQVILAGTGPGALLDTDKRPLAGSLGEVVPAGAGRDATLFVTHPATA